MMRHAAACKHSHTHRCVLKMTRKLQLALMPLPTAKKHELTPQSEATLQQKHYIFVYFVVASGLFVSE